MIVLRANESKDIEINIGYQSVTSQTWGAVIIKEAKIFENLLKAAYPEQTIHVNWYDEISGAVINTSMISGKIQLGFMGDMPCILNAYKGATQKEYNSFLIAFDGKGENGKNQAIVVPKNSDVNAVEDLAGKCVSVPIGSSAHKMLLKILEKKKLLDQVEIVHQDVPLAISMLTSKKVDAFAVWSPYPIFLEEKGYGNVVAEGEISGEDYLAGVMVDTDWAERNEEIVMIFLKSLIEAHQMLRDNPKEAATIIATSSEFPQKVVEEAIAMIRWDSGIYEKDINTLYENMKFLSELGVVQEFELRNYIFTDYLEHIIIDTKLDSYEKTSLEWPSTLY